MSWKAFIDKVYVVNLQKREDRLLETAKLLEEYEIPYTVFPAIEDREQGARGLRDSMLQIFNEAIEAKYDNVLVFEDDVRFLTDKQTFHSVMDASVKQLPENYHLFYLGGQPTAGYSYRHSVNLLPALKYFATQSVVYSSQGMKEIIARNFGYPIDNWIVDNIQNEGRCFAVDPILCSQRAGISDIGGNFIDWNFFIEPRHNQKVAEMTWK